MPPKRRRSSPATAARRGSSPSGRGSHAGSSPAGSRRSSPAPSGRCKEIMDELMASGESEGFALGAVRSLNSDSRWNGTDVIVKDDRGNDLNLVEHAGLKVKTEWFSNLYLFPSWLPRVEQFQKEVLDRFFLAHSSEKLMHLYEEPSSVHLAWQAAVWTAMQESVSFTCPICAEAFVQIRMESDGRIIEHVEVSTTDLTEWTPSLRKTEHWSSNPCGHVCCLSCMQSWVETSINDQKTQIKCPAVGCSHVLWDHDVKTLVSEDVFKSYTELKQTDHLKKLEDDLKDADLSAWLKANARPCPDCHIVVSRSEGCNVMMCVCGCKFMYCCGFKSCRCGKPSKPDIWNP
eukprot:TRINITY_DN61831_c0_g1_i1.p1 TRINITY_DN61831_c0_g1~~TRINITY_DN61831_c0_g1_i1.p1  ORF type:complete len:346 (+),score=35.72 TRINITY_DN61831_c0_g1_i1:140-1177(+)